MPHVFTQERKQREREERARTLEHRKPGVDKAPAGVVKEFLNGWKVVFRANGAYYLVDEFSHASHICSYSKRDELFHFLKFNDLKLNFADAETMGMFLFAFTGKRNCWTGVKHYY
jgi:hypothetical protein